MKGHIRSRLNEVFLAYQLFITTKTTCFSIKITTLMFLYKNYRKFDGRKTGGT